MDFQRKDVETEMKAEAIVYTSNTGYTEAYAKLLGEKTGMPVYSFSEAKAALPKRTQIIYFGWLMASHIRGYKKAAKLYDICVVCGVGLCDTGALMDEVRAASALPQSLTLFTLQGGMDITKLKGINKMMIKALTNAMENKKDRTEGEERMLMLLKKGGNYVSEENLEKVIEFCAQ